VTSYIFSASVHLEASADAVFAFHEDPRNISQIAPDGLRVLKVEASSTAREGDLFTIWVRQFGMSLRWVGRWERVVAGRLLVDVGVKCPFPSWRHEHHFKAIGESHCRMTDRVTVSAPIPGFALGAAIILRRMFHARHAATSAFFNDSEDRQAASRFCYPKPPRPRSIPKREPDFQ
jgi:ligand-binding SRPBCC domain-containing protein